MGDLNKTTTIEIIAPPIVTELSWNGALIQVNQTSRGTLTGNLVVEELGLALPILNNWKVSGRYSQHYFILLPVYFP